jgi:hypothetical protein
LLLFGAGIGAVFLALQRGQWRVALAVGGIFVIGAVYLGAVIRGRPL